MAVSAFLAFVPTLILWAYRGMAGWCFQLWFSDTEHESVNEFELEFRHLARSAYPGMIDNQQRFHPGLHIC